MQNTPEEIVLLARQAGVQFGQHAFLVVQKFETGQCAERPFLVIDKAEDALKDAEAFAVERRAAMPSSSFYIQEVGAGDPQAVDLIRTLHGLLDEALTTHIYDDDDDVPDDCAYHAAVAEAEAYLAGQRMSPDGRAMALLRALTIDLDDGDHEDADLLTGLRVVEAAALDLLGEVGLKPVSRDFLPDPDEETIASVYEAAIEVAYQDTPAPFLPAPIGLLEIAEALADATEGLDHQLEQVCLLHHYSDDDTKAAQREGDEARERLRLYNKGAPKAVLYLNLSESAVDIWSAAPLPGLEIVTLDWDIDDLRNYTAEDVTMVRFGDDKPEPCLVSTEEISVSDRVPVMRPATEEDMA